MIRFLFGPVYNININLLEILQKDDIIEPAYDYIDGATDNNISRYSQHPTMIELKQDLIDFANDIAVELNKVDGVRSVTIDDRSPYAGLSTYLNINYNKPTNTDYLHSYKNEYTTKVRISDHYDNIGGLEDYEIDVVGKDFYNIQDELISLAKQHKQYLDNLYNDWQETHTVTQAQRDRNRQRSIKRARARNRGNRRNNH